MDVWHDRWWAGPLLRLGGLLLVGLGWLVARRDWLSIHTPPRHLATGGELLLAMIAFLCASSGAAMAAMGAHLFDPVALSDRWRPRW